MVVIHTNMNLHNQVETAGWLKQGLDRKGMDCVITPDKTAPGDIHIIQGPHYCYSEWVGQPDVLWLNRTFYGNSRFSISLGWLNADGSRDFYNKNMAEGKGQLPELKPKKQSERIACVFADYDMNMLGLVIYASHNWSQAYYRPHPAQHTTTELETLTGDLSAVWEKCDVAVGHGSTALVEAELNGLKVVSTDPHHVCHDANGRREQWLKDLSWAQWTHTELINGDWIDHLC